MSAGAAGRTDSSGSLRSDERGAMAPSRHEVSLGSEGYPTPAEAKRILTATRRVGSESQKEGVERREQEARASASSRLRSSDI